MHTKLSRFALAGVALVSSCFLPGCDKTQSLLGPSQNTDPVVVSVRVDPSSVNVGATADVTAVVTDADGDKITCEWSSSSGGVFTGLSSDRCRSRWRPGSTLGTVQLRVMARDTRGGSASGSADAIVGDNTTAGGPGPQPTPVPTPEPPGGGGKPGPQPTPQPEPTPTPDPSPSPSPSPGPGNRPPNVQITAAQGSCAAPCQITVTAQGSDPDSDRITLHFSGCASGDFNGATATALCDVPTASTFTATVTARDMLGASSQASVTVSGVASTNRPPTVTVVAEKPTCHPRPGQACTVLVSAQASDPDGDVLTYEWSGCATGRGTSATCQIGTLSAFTASVVVRDGRGASASSSVTLHGVNTAPSANPSAAATGCHPYPNECAVEVSANGTDADGDPLTYSWAGCANGADTTAKCLVPLLSTGVQAATVTITDPWTSVTRSVNVKALNSPPSVSVSSAVPGCHPRPGAPCWVTVRAEASDPDGDPVTLAWSGCAAGTRPITDCEVYKPGAHTATALVKDAFDATRSASVNVQGMNRAPVVTASPSSGAGYSFPFRWEWADTDGDILRCVFEIADPAHCVYAGGCWNIGGTANGSSDCEACTRLATDLPSRCTYSFQCFDGWVTSSTTFQLN